MIITIKSRDNKELRFSKEELLKLDDFYIKNLIVDVDDDNNTIEINEDYEIIQCIYDSLRYNTLIINDKTNLRLMYMVADKWCTPIWLLESLSDKLSLTDRQLKYCNLVEKLTHNIVKCKICGCGFDKNKNTSTSCKTHFREYVNSGTEIYSCCGKSEPCMIGYHVEDVDYIFLQNLKNI